MSPRRRGKPLTCGSREGLLIIAFREPVGECCRVRGNVVASRRFTLPIDILTPESKVDAERSASHTASLEARQVYRWLEDEEMRTRSTTRLRHSRALDVWQESIRLRINHMLPTSSVEFPKAKGSDLVAQSNRFSVEFRTYMLAWSIHVEDCG